MANFSSPFGVGQSVRVWKTLAKEESQRALISWVEASPDDGTWVDVIFDGSGSEECRVPLQRLVELEPWEKEPPAVQVQVQVQQEALDLKERGNLIIQKYRDVASARRLYSAALAMVTPPLSVGARVLVLSSKSQCLSMLPAIVADVEEVGGSVDVMYDEEEFVCWAAQDGDEDAFKEQDESAVLQSRIAIALNPDSSLLELQRSCSINMARCCLRDKNYGWGVRHASIAASIARLLDNSKAFADALVIRSKVLLSANKPISARKDALRLRLRLGGEDGRLLALLAEIDAVVKEQRKGNRQMAKEIANWVEQAMSTGSGSHS